MVRLSELKPGTRVTIIHYGNLYEGCIITSIKPLRALIDNREKDIILPQVMDIG